MLSVAYKLDCRWLYAPELFSLWVAREEGEIRQSCISVVELIYVEAMCHMKAYVVRIVGCIRAYSETFKDIILGTVCVVANRWDDTSVEQYFDPGARRSLFNSAAFLRWANCHDFQVRSNLIKHGFKLLFIHVSELTRLEKCT